MNTTRFDGSLFSAMASSLASSSSSSRHPAVETPEEVQLYISKLKDMVPLCPKNNSVSKLEVIQHVIDYIDDLQQTLHSDSETDSPPESPMEDVSFSDAFSQQLEFHGYGSRPHQQAREPQYPSAYSAVDSDQYYSAGFQSSSSFSDHYSRPNFDDCIKTSSGFPSGFESYGSGYRSSQRN